jgi:hypothetical protein
MKAKSKVLNELFINGNLIFVISNGRVNCIGRWIQEGSAVKIYFDEDPDIPYISLRKHASKQDIIDTLMNRLHL